MSDFAKSISDIFDGGLKFISAIWETIKSIFSFLFPYLLVAFILWVIVSTIRAYKKANTYAKERGYKDRQDYLDKVWRPRRKARKLAKQEQKMQNRALTAEQKSLIDAETKAWADESIGALDGFANEPYQQQLALQIETMKRHKLRRSFLFIPDPTMNELHHEIELSDDGKVERGLTSVFGKSQYIWTSHPTGKTVAEQTLPLSEIQISLASGRYDSESNQFNCINCGSPFSNLNDDVLHCPYCKGISYREDYKNLMTQLNVFAFNTIQRLETKLSSFLIRFAVIFAFIIVLLFSIYSLAVAFASDTVNAGTAALFQRLRALIPSLDDIFLALGINNPTARQWLRWIPAIFLLASPNIIYKIKTMFSERKYKIEKEIDLEIAQRQNAIAKLKRLDPLFSIDLAKSELLMMFKAIRLQTDHEGRKVWGIYTDPQHRNAMQAYFQTQPTAVDVIINQVILDRVWSEDSAKPYLSFYISYALLVESDCQFSLQSDEISITLTRNINGRTVLLDREGKAECPNCGAAVLLLTQDTCHYCQTAFHRDEMYWRIFDLAKATHIPHIDPEAEGSRRSTFRKATQTLRESIGR